MRKVATYGLILLAVLICSRQLSIGQEKERVKSIEELQQLERGVLELKGADTVLVHAMPAIAELPIGYFQGSTSLTIMKKMRELTGSKTFTFNIEEGYSDVNLMLVSGLEDGDIKIKLLKPDKKLLKEIKLGPGQNQSWNKSYCLEEYAGQGFTGKWAVELSCKDATGYYQFVLSSR